MIVYVSDFDLRGSGYKNIGVPLVTGLTEQGYEVLVLGLGYRGQPHDFPFALCPAGTHQISKMMQVLPSAPDVEIEAYVVALDIPMQLRLKSQMNNEIPWVGIFPVEGDPLCPAWSARLWSLNERLIISRFGTQEAHKSGLEASHIQIGVDCEFWKPHEPAERQQLRELLELDDKFVVLTVADNQERKNLSATAQILGRVAQELDLIWCLVTRPDSPVGWELQDLVEENGLVANYLQWTRGIEVEELKDLYGMADLFLLTSKAEGLGMPVLEAMAMGVPVMATDCCGIHEHLDESRGFLIPYEFRHQDPWGNSHRYYIDREVAIATILEMPAWSKAGELDAMVKGARNYVEQRDWEIAVNTLVEAIENVKA